jgi:hypothetical protein
MSVARKIPDLPRHDVPLLDPKTGVRDDPRTWRMDTNWYRAFSELFMTLREMRDQAALTYSELGEMTAPSAPSADAVRIYAEDDGGGKTQLMALFPTGVAQQIAIEP